MQEYPVFIPWRDEYLGAVVSVGDGEPAGLAVLCTGGFFPRCHRNQVWTRLSRRLASRGVAAVRLDFKGIGDSSAKVRAFEHRNEERVDQLLAVTRFVRDAVGVDRVVMVGTCGGAVSALRAATDMDYAAGAVGVRMPTLAKREGDVRRRLKDVPVVSAVTRSRQWQRYVHPVLASRRGRAARSGTPRGPLAPPILIPYLRRARLLLLSGRDDPAYTKGLAPYLDRISGMLSGSEREALRSVAFPGRSIEGFETLEIQRAVIEECVDWIPRCFGSAAPTPPGGEQASPSVIRR